MVVTRATSCPLAAGIVLLATTTSARSGITHAFIAGGSLLSPCSRRVLSQRMSSRYMSTEASSPSPSSSPQTPKVLVLGGNGYVGSRVVKAALRRGATVVSVNRSGQPKGAGQGEEDAWVSKVKWVAADIFDSASWKGELGGGDVTGVVSCVGAFGSNAFMERINGDANIHAVEVTAQAGVPRFVYVSTVENNLPSFILSGYFNGKRRAEQAVLTTFPETGVVLRPSFVYGTRQVGSVALPLALVGKPLEVVFRLPPFTTLKNLLPGAQAILAPPVSVDAVGAVAAAAALGKDGGGIAAAGILHVDDIARLARSM